MAWESVWAPCCDRILIGTWRKRVSKSRVKMEYKWRKDRDVGLRGHIVTVVTIESKHAW